MIALDVRKTLLAQKLRKAREVLGISKSDMAKEIKVPYSCYKEYEGGKVLPAPERLEAILSWIDCTDEEKNILRDEIVVTPIETPEEIKPKDECKNIFPSPEDWATIDQEGWKKIVDHLRELNYSEETIAEMAGLSSPNSVRNIWRHPKGQAGATRMTLLKSLQQLSQKDIVNEKCVSSTATKKTGLDGKILLPLSDLLGLISNPLMDFVQNSTYEERVSLREIMGDNLDDLLAAIRGLFSEKSRDQMLSERERGDKSYYRKDVNDNDK